MRRIMGIIAFVCAFTIITATAVTATDYTPIGYYAGWYKSGEEYTGTINEVEISGGNVRGGKLGTFVLDNNINTGFTQLMLCAQYGSVSYDVGAEYTFAITLTFGVSGDYTSTTTPVLYSCNVKSMSGILAQQVIGRTLVAQGGTRTEGASNSITYTYTGIPYEKVVGKSYFQIGLNRTYLDDMGTDTIYIANTYFGLSSSYDEDDYKSQTIENMREINNSLTNINNSIDNTNNKLDETNGKLDGIQNSIDNQLDDELNKAETGGNANNAEAENSISSLPNFSESYNNILNNLTTPLYDESVRKTIPLPNGQVNVLGLNVDIWQGKSEVDLTTFLNNEKMQTIIVISKAFSILACMGISVKWAYKIKEAITSNDEVDVPIPFVDGK